MDDGLAGFILARIAEVEQMAHDASGRTVEDHTDGKGDHWQWEDTETDEPVDLSDTEWFADRAVRPFARRWRILAAQH